MGETIAEAVTKTIEESMEKTIEQAMGKTNALETHEERSYETSESAHHSHNVKPEPREYKYVWGNIVYYILLHISALSGMHLAITSAKYRTILQAILFVILGNLGITAGAHRLWAHRSYKAKLPLKIFLLVLQTLAFQNSVIEWSKDHRAHHKASDTDGDPHNANRGFFFSHMGWLMVRKHPEVKKMYKVIDMSDLTNDKYLKFQHKYYLYIMPLLSLVLPTILPMVLWDETFSNAFHINITRYCIALHITWLVNSAAHMFGYKPYDQFIKPSENMTVAVLALGEGWHNYHHAFPWDYKTSEIGKYGLNLTTVFINSMSYLGLAYDLKAASMQVVRQRSTRTGPEGRAKQG